MSDQHPTPAARLRAVAKLDDLATEHARAARAALDEAEMEMAYAERAQSAARQLLAEPEYSVCVDSPVAA
jgi:hypothetical protein